MNRRMAIGAGALIVVTGATLAFAFYRSGVDVTEPPPSYLEGRKAAQRATQERAFTEKSADSKTETPKETWPVTYIHPLAYLEERMEFYAPDPYFTSLTDEPEYESREASWSPNGRHRLFITFHRPATGELEGIALTITDTISGRSVTRELDDDETLVYALESEAGMPMYDIDYDPKTEAVVYSVYRRTAHVTDKTGPWDEPRTYYPASREFIETRTIRFNEVK